MILKYKDALKIYGSDYQIKKAIGRKELYQVARGLYSKEPYIDEQKEIFVRFDYVVLTLQSAFYFHGMTDYIPEYTYVATPRNSHHLSTNNVKQIFMSDKYIDIGVEIIKQEGYDLKVFNFERTLIELIRYEKKIPYEEYLHVLKNYREKSHKLDIRKLINYANQFNSKKKLLKVIERSVI